MRGRLSFLTGEGLVCLMHKHYQSYSQNWRPSLSGDNPLIRLGYTKGSLDFYRRRWKQLLCYANEKGINVFSEELGTDFLKTVRNIPIEDDHLTQSQVQDMRVIRMLVDFQLHHCVLRRYFKHKNLLHNEYYINILDKFKAHCTLKEYSQSTISI